MQLLCTLPKMQASANLGICKGPGNNSGNTKWQPCTFENFFRVISFEISKAERICWLFEGRDTKPEAEECWECARIEFHSSTGFKPPGFFKGLFSCLDTVYTALLVDEVEVQGCQGARVTCTGEKGWGYEKQLQAEPLRLHLQNAVQRKASKCSILSSIHACYLSGPGNTQSLIVLSLPCYWSLLASLSRYLLLPHSTRWTRKFDFFE